MKEVAVLENYHGKLVRSKMSFKASMRCVPCFTVVVLLLSVFTVAPAFADTWTSALTPIQVQSQDVGGELVVYVDVSQSLLNPAGCLVTDQYATDDSVITNQVLAQALSALASGAQIKVYVSSANCAAGRPKIIGIQTL